MQRTKRGWQTYLSPVLRWPYALVVVCMFGVSTGTAVAAAQTGTSTEMSAAELASLIDPLVTRQLAERRIAGAVVIAVHGGMVVHARGYGVADVAVGRPMSTATPVRLASISKMFTAAAVLQLVERRVVSLDADARTYLELPALPPGDPPLTIGHLLTHRGGFEYRTSGILSLHGPRAPLPQYLASHWPPRRADAGSVVAYSNFGYTVLAAVVEGASGQPFESYLEEHLFTPLGMGSTTAQQLPGRVGDVVSLGYDRADVAATPWSSASPVVHEAGSTGVVAPADDVARFLLALLASAGGEPGVARTSRVFSPAVARWMLSPQVELGSSFVGLGAYAPVASGANPFVGHDGGSGGFHGTVALMPRAGFGLFVSYNSQGIASRISAEGELVRVVGDRFFPDATGSSITGAASSAPLLPASGMTGVFEPTRRSDGSLFSLSALIGQLAFRPAGDGHLQLAPAWLPVGGFDLQRVRPGVFRSDAFEVAFERNGSQVTARIGAPVARYVAVPVWRRAGLVVPLVAVSLLFGGATLMAWPLRRRRRRAQMSDTRGRRAFTVSRVALMLLLAATLAALWLVFSRTTLVVADAPVLAAIVAAIYAAAWAGVALTLLVIWWTTWLWRHRALPLRALLHQSLVTAALVVLALFCVVWKVAGTTMQL